MTDAYFGWHGWYLGEAGFGLAFNHLIVKEGDVEADRNRWQGEYKQGGEEVTNDIFDIGVRYRFADAFFVEGGVELLYGSSDLANDESSSTTFSLGVGTTF